jgi:hypothetical protein
MADSELIASKSHESQDNGRVRGVNLFQERLAKADIEVTTFKESSG